MATDIYEVLTERHDAARALLNGLAASSASGNAKLRREKLHKLAIALISHHEAESATLYDRLMEFDDLRDQVEEHQAQHEEANDELRSLMEVDVEETGWLEQLQAIKKAVEDHIEDEENLLFPAAQQHLDDDEAVALAGDFNREQARRRESLKAA